MSDSVTKTHEEDFIFWEEQQQTVHRDILTPLQACNILNHLVLKYDFSADDLEEIDLLKNFIKKRGI